MYYVYVLRSLKDNTFYIGQTKDLEERLKRHNSGRSPFTADKKPWKIVYIEEYISRELAQKREEEIKNKKSRKYIEYLINSINNASEPSRYSSGRKNL